MVATIEVAAATDSTYAQHCAVMIASTLRNTASAENVSFHILDCGLNANDAEQLRRTCEALGANITFYTINRKHLEDLPQTRHTASAYARLFIGSILPQSINRIIYLDSDLVVLDDIAKLYKCDLRGKIAACARDFTKKTKPRLRKPPNFYFNSGVMLIDLKTWRRESTEKNLIEYLTTTHDQIKFADQDALNITLAGSIQELPPRWNAQLGVFTTRPRRWEPYGFKKAQLVEALKRPAIVHYVNNSKPWLFRSTHPLKALYWHYIESTTFPETFYPDISLRNIVKKILSPRRQIKGVWCRWQFKKGSQNRLMS